MKELNAARNAFRKKIMRPLPFRAYMLSKLPAAFFMGLRLEQLEDSTCSVSVPYKYMTKNPFRSIYFAAQAAAAELSTGIMARMAIQGYPPISMLIIHTEADFVKKATSKTVFTCRDGEKILAAVDQAVESGEPVEITAETEGIQETGETVSRMRFTWSFRTKS